MSDGVGISSVGSTIVSTEEITTLNGGAASAQHVQRITPTVITANGTAVDVTAAAPLPVTISGGATAANQATGNTALSAIQTAVEALDNAISGNEMQVDVLTLPALPAGTNNIGDVDVLSLPALPAGTNNIGDVDVLTLPTLPAGDNNIGNVDVLTLPALAAGNNNIGDVDIAGGNVASGAADSGNPVKVGGVYNSSLPTFSNGQRGDLQIDSQGSLRVNPGELDSAIDSVSCVQSGTWTEANSAAMAASLSVMDDWDNAASDGASVSGDVAHDAADAGEPVKVGGKAYNVDGTAPGTAVAEGDRANFITDLEGRQFVSTFHPNFFTLFEDHTSAQTNNQLKTAPGASLSIYITDVVVSNGATAGSLKLVEDEGGTPAQIGGTMYLGINGGAVINWKTPKKLTANKSLGFTSTTVTTHSIEIHGYIAP